MPRNSDPLLNSDLASDSYSFATLITIGQSPEQPLFLTDNDKDVTVTNGDTFISSSAILSFGEVSETAIPTQGGIDITFSGVDQTMISYFLNTDYVGKYVSVARCTLTATNVFRAKFNYFIGTISNFTITDTTSTSEVVVSCKSHWEDFDKRNGRRTNHNSQQLHFAGDEGFEFGAKTLNDIRWGKA